MNSGKFKKIALWGVAILTIINFAILIVIGYYWFFIRPSINRDFTQNRFKECSCNYNNLFRDCECLDSTIFIKYERLKNNYRKKTYWLADSLRELRFLIMDELQKDKPDTLLINKLVENSGQVYTKLRKITISEFMLMRDSFPQHLRNNFFFLCGRGEGYYWNPERFKREKFIHKRHNFKNRRHIINNNY